MEQNNGFQRGDQVALTEPRPIICLLYTSPSPRDGLLSIRRAASDVYKRQASFLNCQEKHFCDNGAKQRISARGPSGLDRAKAYHLSLIHISEPTRRTPLYSSGSVRCV